MACLLMLLPWLLLLPKLRIQALAVTLLGKGSIAEPHHWPVLCCSKHQVLLLPANLGGQRDGELQKNGKNMFKSAKCLNQDVHTV